MKGNQQLIDTLNALLADELTAINQYMVHSEMCARWGYNKLHGINEKRAIDEMKHAEALIGRILYLEGLPVVSKLNALKIGAAVEKQIANDWVAEDDAIKAYNAAIVLAGELGDNGTANILQGILDEEEAHMEILDSQTEQIKQMGVQNYLTLQL